MHNEGVALVCLPTHLQIYLMGFDEFWIDTLKKNSQANLILIHFS
jgi:hypothetical protein